MWYSKYTATGIYKQTPESVIFRHAGCQGGHERGAAGERECDAGIQPGARAGGGGRHTGGRAQLRRHAGGVPWLHGLPPAPGLRSQAPGGLCAGAAVDAEGPGIQAGAA